jgi:hypothetical protein
MNSDYFWLIAAGAIFFYAYRSDKKAAEKRAASSKRHDETFPDEEETRSIHRRFHENFQKNPDLPDSVSGEPAYLYERFMIPWFQQLSARNRYNDRVAHQLRKDWLGYLEALEQYETCSFLRNMAHEKGDIQKADERNDEARQHRVIRISIEDAFAAAMGTEEVKELSEVRSRKGTYFEEDRARKERARTSRAAPSR